MTMKESESESETESEIISSIIIQDNFINQNQCDELIRIYNAADVKVTSLIEVFDVGLVHEITDKVISLINDRFSKSKSKSQPQQRRQMFTDYIVLATRTGDNNVCALHCDNLVLDCPTHGDIQATLREVGCNCPDATYKPNHTGWRDYTGLLYLDSKHKGGQIIFQDGPISKIYTKQIEAIAGRLVLTPNNRFYYHETTPVTEGVRYSLNMWFTSDRSKAWLQRNERF